MALSLAIIIILALSFNKVFEKIKLPGLLGMLILGIIIGPYGFDLINNKRGTNKGIPTLILTGASIDDVFAITIFSTFLGLYGGSHMNITKQLLNITISIIYPHRDPFFPQYSQYFHF